MLERGQVDNVEKKSDSLEDISDHPDTYSQVY